MRQGLDDNTFFVGSAEKGSTLLDLAQVTRAMRDQRKIRITHTDQIGTVSDRTKRSILAGRSLGFHNQFYCLKKLDPLMVCHCGD
ncbi:hypothetical protein RCCGE510_08176 [Rhizobium sp. CCGE 510]|nr:hypothetical protein RCCGE510_08176 [Rhizobium sp. CCGE 510]